MPSERRVRRESLSSLEEVVDPATEAERLEGKEGVVKSSDTRLVKADGGRLTSRGSSGMAEIEVREGEAKSFARLTDVESSVSTLEVGNRTLR